MRKRGEVVERSFAHVLDRCSMRDEVSFVDIFAAVQPRAAISRDTSWHSDARSVRSRHAKGNSGNASGPARASSAEKLGYTTTASPRRAHSIRHSLSIPRSAQTDFTEISARRQRSRAIKVANSAINRTRLRRGDVSQVGVVRS
jgi:hypothetical protein